MSKEKPMFKKGDAAALGKELDAAREKLGLEIPTRLENGDLDLSCPKFIEMCKRFDEKEK